MAPWRIERDVVVAGALRVAVQRIGIGHWKPAERLRSWGIAPLHRDRDAILVPCDAVEALWLGAWLEDSGDAAKVTLTDPATGDKSMIDLPAEDQLTSLIDASRALRPLTALNSLGRPQRHVLELGLESGARVAVVELVLVPPDDWTACSGREAPAPLLAPPPRPPRLG